MKKRLIKNYLKRKRLLFLLNILFIFSCSESETDFVSELKSIQPTITNSSIVSYSGLMKKEELTNSLKEIERFTDDYKKTELSNKIESNDKSFTILTDEVFVVESELGTTYTFKIQDNDNESSTFSNFIIELYDNNDYVFFKMDFTSNDSLNSDLPYNIKRTEIGENEIDIENFFSNQERVIIQEGNTCYEYIWVYSPRDFEPDLMPVEVDCPEGLDSGEGTSGGGTSTSNPTSSTTATGSTNTSSGTGGTSGDSNLTTSNTNNPTSTEDGLPEDGDALPVGALTPDTEICQSGYEKDTNGLCVEAPDQIIIDPTFENNPCLFSVYEEMGKATAFNNYIKNFDSEFSIADLKLSTDDNYSQNPEYQNYLSAMTITKPPLVSNLIEIVFNTDSSLTSSLEKQPDVFKAVAMIHEMIHAEMYRKMLDVIKASEINQSTNLNWTNWSVGEFNLYLDSLENKYFGIFDYYTRFDWNTSTPNNAQHQAMAQHYRDIIKSALTDFDSTLTEAEKEALSWIGLKDANIVAWQNYTDKTNVNSTLSIIKNTFTNGCN